MEIVYLQSILYCNSKLLNQLTYAFSLFKESMNHRFEIQNISGLKNMVVLEQLNKRQLNTIV